MKKVTEDEVLSMSVKELGSRLEELGWRPVSDELVDDEIVNTVFAKTFNINDWKGLENYITNFDYSHSNDVKTNIIEDPVYFTYELNIVDHTGEWYCWSMGENPNNCSPDTDFEEDDDTFTLVTAMILNGEFATRRETAFADIWETVWQTDDGHGDIPNYYLTLVQATEYWEGYVCGADYGESTTIQAGDYAIMAEENRENSPAFYYLISKEQAEEVLHAKDDEEAFEIMSRILEEYE